MNLTETFYNQVIKDRDTKPERIPQVSPSNLGGCIRKLKLMEQGAPHTKPDALTECVFTLGRKVEDFVYETLKGAGIIHAYQLSVKYRDISGTLDFVFKDDEGKLFLMDCKSVKSEKFAYLDRGEVDEKYAMQLTFYWLGLKLLPGYDNLSEQVCVMYVEKNNLLVKEVWFNVNDWIPKVNAKLDDVFFARASATVPAEKEVRDWECFSVSEKFCTVKVWCNYIENCPRIMAEHKAEVERIAKMKAEKEARRKK